MADLNLSSRLIKYLLFLFNLLFVITGIVLICLGVVIKAANEKYIPLLDDRFLSTPTLLIFSGSIIFFIAFFGCCGALKENQCMVFTYSVLLGAVFVMEVTAGITGYILSDETSQILTQTVKKSMSQYNHTDESTILWDKLQTVLHCCGAKNYTDWYDALKEQDNLPMTCCGTKVGAVGVSTCNGSSPNLHKTPCMDLLATEIENNALAIGGTALGIAFFQLMGIIFSCSLGRKIKQSTYETV